MTKAELINQGSESAKISKTAAALKEAAKK
jgi:hypothetical protein